jgi:hypothetical protein
MLRLSGDTGKTEEAFQFLEGLNGLFQEVVRRAHRGSVAELTPRRDHRVKAT